MHAGQLKNNEVITYFSLKAQNITSFHQKQESKQINNKSAITDHAGRKNHVIDWEGTHLVARENQDSARRIREAIWIKCTPNNMNRGRGRIPAV